MKAWVLWTNPVSGAVMKVLLAYETYSACEKEADRQRKEVEDAFHAKQITWDQRWVFRCKGERTLYASQCERSKTPTRIPLARLGDHGTRVRPALVSGKVGDGPPDLDAYLVNLTDRQQPLKRCPQEVLHLFRHP